MPPWAALRRINEVKPSFDIFAIGKVLWSLVSGQPTLPYWYFERSQFNLERMFPQDPRMSHVNKLLAKMIVEEEDRCLPDAAALIEEIDSAIRQLNGNTAAVPIKSSICRFCVDGKYETIAYQNNALVRNFGITPTGTNTFKILKCNHCGHCEIFLFADGVVPQAWNELK